MMSMCTSYIYNHKPGHINVSVLMDVVNCGCGFLFSLMQIVDVDVDGWMNNLIGLNMKMEKVESTLCYFDKNWHQITQLKYI